MSLTIPPLVLHFDVDRTIILNAPGDVSGVECLPGSLAESCLGVWSESGKVESYASYLRSTPTEPLARKERMNGFVDMLRTTKEHPLIKEWKSQSAAITDRYDRLCAKVDGCADNAGVFPSLNHLVRTLKANDVSFCLALRTFGDKVEVLCQDLHESPEWGNLDVPQWQKGQMQARNLRVEEHSESKVYTTAEDIFSCMSPVKGGKFLGIKDEGVTEWRDSLRSAKFGKPFLYDARQELSVAPSEWPIGMPLSLFFDDGINVGRNAPCIVCPWELGDSELDIHTRAEERVLRLAGRSIFQVDAIQALEDEGYFIRLLNTALSARGFLSQLPITAQMGC